MNNNTKICKNCNLEIDISLFYKNKQNLDGLGSYCKDCTKARSAKWKLENKERHYQQSINWRAANPERKRISDTKWRKANKDKIKKSANKYQTSHPERQSDFYHKRKALKLKNGVFEISKKFLKNLYSSPCNCCGKYGDIHMDHIIPLSRGGRHSEGNLQPLCSKCNLSKSDKTMTEWYKMKRQTGGS